MAEELGVVCRPAEERRVIAFVAAESAAQALLIEGEAGMGKSTLWAAGVAAAMAQGSTVLSVRPAQSEARMSFAALADLLEPVADAVLPRLDPPARTVLEVVLLRRLPTGAPAHEREIGTAVLAALRVLASDRPVLVAVDDLQWLDEASNDVLAFAIRRLRDESVLVLLTRRTGDQPMEDCVRVLIGAMVQRHSETMTLQPLADAEVTRLVRTGLGSQVAQERGLVEAAGGNPYWATELVKATLGAKGARGVAVPPSLTALLNQRVSGEDEPARTALVVVAALSRPTWGATRRALAVMTDDPDAAMDAAVSAGLVSESAGRLRPAHPLLGSVALGSLQPGERRRLHRRLAEVTAEPEQRARHLALATDGEPDADVADALETGAQSARSRGATRAAVELAELAVQLTPAADPRLSGRRLVAAELRFATGDLARACELAEAMVAAGPAPHEWPALLPLLVESTYWVRGQPAAQALLRGVLDQPDTDVRRRAVALACAADVGDGKGTTRSQLAGEAIALFDQLGDTDPGPLSQALIYLAEDHLDTGHGMALDLLGRAEAAEEGAVQRWAVPVFSRARSVRAYQLKLVDDLDGARREVLLALSVARAEGDDASEPALLGHLALTELWAGRFAEALAAADEGLRTAAGVVPATLYAARALLAVHTGEPALARELISGQLEASGAPTRKTVAYQHVLGLAALLDGDQAVALDHLEQAWAAAQALGIEEPGRRQRLEGDLGQVLVADGQLPRVLALAEAQIALGERFGRPTVVGVGHRLRGLVEAASGDLDAAAASLELAVESHRCSPLALELPRSQLNLGLVQRRLKDKQAARVSLRAAVAGFTAIGAGAWLALAEAELARLDGPRAGSQLTRTEERVAQLATDGRNNREIAAALFISPRTVEGHLASIYRKLGISGRAHLRRLADPSAEPAKSPT